MEPRMMIQEGLTPLSEIKEGSAVKRQEIQKILHSAFERLDNAGKAVPIVFQLFRNDEIFNTGYGEAV